MLSLPSKTSFISIVHVLFISSRSVSDFSTSMISRWWSRKTLCSPSMSTLSPMTCSSSSATTSEMSFPWLIFIQSSSSQCLTQRTTSHAQWVPTLVAVITAFILFKGFALGERLGKLSRWYEENHEAILFERYLRVNENERWRFWHYKWINNPGLKRTWATTSSWWIWKRKGNNNNCSSQGSNFVHARLRLLCLLPGNYHLMFPLYFVGLKLGTIYPLIIGIGAENQWVYSFHCQFWKDELTISNKFECRCQLCSQSTLAWQAIQYMLRHQERQQNSRTPISHLNIRGLPLKKKETGNTLETRELTYSYTFLTKPKIAHLGCKGTKLFPHNQISFC